MFSGYRGEKSRLGAGLQKLLRAPSEPIEPCTFYRQLRSSHRFKHFQRAGSNTQEGRFDSWSSSDEHYWFPESSCR